MKESLQHKSFDTFKSNPTSYIAVGVMCGMFLILSVLVSLIDPLLLVVALPIIGLPFLFASHVSCYFLRINQPITISAYFRYFLGFFRAQFRGSFRAIISYLKSLAVYFAGIFVASIVIYLIYKMQYGVLFTEALNKFVYQYVSSAEYTYEDIMDLLYENNNLLLTFFIYISAFGIPLAVLAFIYYISFSSLSIYYRTSLTIVASPLLKMSVGNTYNKYRKKMRLDWLKLNWLIFVLPLIGSGLGALVYFLVIKNILYFAPALTIGAFIPYLFFLPFYFPNMEVLYHRYENVFKEGNKMAIESFLERIQRSLELSEEEKRNLEESFKENNDDKE